MTQSEISLETTKNVLIVCPKCKQKKQLGVPIKIINQSKQLTTVSIPSELCCEHSFQAFIDKNFTVRGYQQVDFDFSKIEFLEDKEEEQVLIPELQEIIKVLRNCVDDKEIMGSALFSIEGTIIYSSLSTDDLFNTIREFEARKEEKLVEIRRIYLVLENEQMVCSKFLEIHENKYILTLIFSRKVKLGMGNLILRQIEKEVVDLAT
jgi:hypothetical protein